MKSQRCRLSVATLLLISLTGLQAQSLRNPITFDNQSGEMALVKLIGPTNHVAEVPNGQKRTINVAPGDYYLLSRYSSAPNRYTYARGDTFKVEETTAQHSVITITLHKVLGGNYLTRETSREEFEGATPGGTGSRVQSTQAPQAARSKTEREQINLIRPVWTVRVETAKLSMSGKSGVEAPRVLLQVVTYNTKGIATENVTHGTEGRKSVITFDGQSKKIMVNYKPDGSIESKVVYTCDDQGNITEGDRYDADGSFEWKEVYTYDAQGNRVEVIWRYPPGPDSTPFFKVIWTYDTEGKVIQQVRYTSEVPDLKSPTSRWVYTYDDTGNVAEATYDIFGAGPKSEKSRYTYDAYDAMGNWTKRTKGEWVTRPGQSSFEPVEVTYRTITYY